MLTHHACASCACSADQDDAETGVVKNPAAIHASFADQELTTTDEGVVHVSTTRARHAGPRDSQA
jgi:hypothetical protein